MLSLFCLHMNNYYDSCNRSVILLFSDKHIKVNPFKFVDTAFAHKCEYSFRNYSICINETCTNTSSTFKYLISVVILFLSVLYIYNYFVHHNSPDPDNNEKQDDVKHLLCLRSMSFQNNLFIYQSFYIIPGIVIIRCNITMLVFLPLIEFALVIESEIVLLANDSYNVIKSGIFRMHSGTTLRYHVVVPRGSSMLHFGEMLTNEERLVTGFFVVVENSNISRTINVNVSLRR